MVGFEGFPAGKQFRDFPHQWIIGRVDLEGDTSLLRPRQREVLRQMFAHDRCLAFILTEQQSPK
jgi:hypothetical protein